jgi:alpha-L-glutamate ligase-like protein
MLTTFFQQQSKLQRKVIGINQRNAALVYRYNRRQDYKWADDKILTKSILEEEGIACADTYAVVERIGDIATAWEAIQEYPKVAIKPANGSGGGGIKVLFKDAEGHWVTGGKRLPEAQIFKHMADILVGLYSLGSRDRVLIEYCIEAHPFFYEIYPAGVPDFRIILLQSVPLMGMLRVPTNRSDGKANLHQGGLGIGIDLPTGTLTQGYDGRSYHDRHPDSLSPIQGKPIPHWDAILQLAVATAQAFPLEYLGVDIVMDDVLGPLVMEINVRPGLSIQTVNKTGMKEALRPHAAFANVFL